MRGLAMNEHGNESGDSLTRMLNKPWEKLTIEKSAGRSVHREELTGPPFQITPQIGVLYGPASVWFNQIVGLLD
jgi:hypothetical protein